MSSLSVWIIRAMAQFNGAILSVSQVSQVSFGFQWDLGLNIRAQWCSWQTWKLGLLANLQYKRACIWSLSSLFLRVSIYRLTAADVGAKIVCQGTHYSPSRSPWQPSSQHRPTGAQKDDDATNLWTSWPSNAVKTSLQKNNNCHSWIQWMWIATFWGF